MDTLYGKQFEDNILLGVQQLESKFRDKVVVKSGVRGKSKSFGYVDAEDAREKLVRHEDTIRDDPGNNRVTGYLHYDYKSLLVDPDDELKILADFKSPYVQTTLAALRRKMDDRIIAAATGIKYTGEVGTTESPWDTNYQVAADGTYVITFAQLLGALELLNNSDVDENEEKFIAVSPRVLSGALNITKLTSADFMTLQALVPGMISNPVLGFKWMVTSRLGGEAATRPCLAWAKSGLGLALGQEIKARVDEIQAKHYAWSTYASMFIGATRIEDKKVIKIICDETKLITEQPTPPA